MKKGGWILVLAVVGCGSDTAKQTWLLPELSASQGLSVTTPEFDVPAGTEVQDCYFFAVPQAIDVDHLKLAINTGSHHMNIFRVKTIVNLDPATGEAVKLGKIDGTVIRGADSAECWKAANWADWPLVANSQSSGAAEQVIDWNLPAGVATHFEAGEMLMLQVHYVNSTDQVTPEAARASLVAAAKAADVAIGLENGADDPKTALTARRGYTGWQIDVKARSAHSSQIFTDEVGAGAIYELARILHTFYDELHGEELLTFNPGLIAGSTQLNFDPKVLHAETFGKDNIVAPVAVATGDLRTISTEQLERTKERMRKIVAASLPGAASTITFSDGGVPMPPTDGNRKLLSMYDAVSRDLGFGPVTAVDPRRAGAADISYAAPYVEMAIDGIGLLGHGNHTPDEVADLRTFPIQSERLAVLLLRLK